MILKIRDNYQNKSFVGTCQAEGGWWIFEPYKIHYHTITWADFRQCTFPENAPANHWWNLGIFAETEEGQDQAVRDKAKLIVLHLGFGPVQEYVIVFDTIAYLCNESGKTVEKIVP